MRLPVFIALFAFVFSFSAEAQEKAGTTLFKAVACLFKSKQKECDACEGPPSLNPQVCDPRYAVTPTGDQLQPFGPYCPTTQAQSHIDDGLGMLPPLPDLRMPDQITKVERKRMEKNANFAERQAVNDARIDERRSAMAEACAPCPDPSTAMMHVQSQKHTAVDHGCRERPETLEGHLKPFNSDSAYYQHGQLKYQWGPYCFEEPPQDQSYELGMLPPLPDLRMPDQITKVERKRMDKNAKFAERQAREDAQRERNRAAYEEKKRKMEFFYGKKY